jgi:hypothetical protein
LRYRWHKRQSGYSMAGRRPRRSGVHVVSTSARFLRLSASSNRVAGLIKPGAERDNIDIKVETEISESEEDDSTVGAGKSRSRFQ